MSGNDLMEIEQKAVAGLLSCFRDLITITAEPVHRQAILEHAALNSLRMQAKTQEMIMHIEDLLKLTRRIRELWVIGPLRKAEGIHGEEEVDLADKKMIEDVAAFGKLYNERELQKYKDLIASLPVSGEVRMVDKLPDLNLGDSTGKSPSVTK